MRISDWSSDVCSSDLPGFSPRSDPPVAYVSDVIAGSRWCFSFWGLACWAELFLKRKLSLPVSNMWQWWVSRSRSAVVILASPNTRSEEHTSELQSLMRISYAVFCLKKKNKHHQINTQLT